MQDYNDDSAIQSEIDDIFGRKDYATKLADVLSSLGNKNSFVVGLYSKWGYGKTSTINLVKQSLLKEDSVEFLDLEPWNYTTDKELAASLLYDLSKKLGLDIEPQEVTRRFLGKLQRKTAKTISEAAASTSVKSSENVTLSMGKVASAVLALTQMLSSPREYAVQKQKIEEVIEASNKQLIVFIDDIDRLDSDKILGIFQLIKSVANIKGVTYFVSFDEQIVSEAIAEKMPKKKGGKDYVDKIIQIPITLPLIERFDLDRYTDQKIEAILKQNDVSLNEDEQTDLQELYGKVKHKLDTPRAINRFANALLFVLPLLKDEVSISDLVSIELIRITYPDLYEAIRNNRDLLTRQKFYDGFDNDNEIKKLRDEFDKAFQSNIEWMQILRTIFPNVNKYYFKSSISDDEKLSRKRRRLKSFEYFNRYFTYSVGTSDTSDAYFIQQLQKDNIGEAELGNLLKKDVNRGLQKIEDNSEVIINVPQFSKALILAAEKLPREEVGFFSSVPVEKSIFLINHLLEQHIEVSALEVYLDIMKSCKETETLSYLMRRVNVNAQAKDEPNKLLSDNEFQEFKKASVKAIQSLIDNNRMPIDDYKTVSCELYQFMYDFQGTADSVNNYIRKRIKTGKQAVDFVSQFLGKWSNLGTSQRFRSDLIESSPATYNYWFSNKLDARHLYNCLIDSSDFKKYKGIDYSAVKSFERHNSELTASAGNEKTPLFREVIAQQFISLFESNLQDKKVLE